MRLLRLGVVGVVVGLLAVAALADLRGIVHVAKRAGRKIAGALADFQATLALILAGGVGLLRLVVLRVRRGIAFAGRGRRIDGARVGRVVGVLALEATGLVGTLLVAALGQPGLLDVRSAGVSAERALPCRPDPGSWSQDP